MQLLLCAITLAVRAAPAIVLATLVSGVISARAADGLIGSGVVINVHGEILTNAHVVEECTRITVRSSAGELAAARLVARDEQNDLAVIRSELPIPFVVDFRDGTPVRAGDLVVALGYPLSGLLATTANLSVGNVSALAGLSDDSRYLQISAPVQPGNSGGPLLDASGHLVGIVTAKLDAALIARFTGDIPQNVNFALRAEVARIFLDSKGVVYETSRSSQQLSPADVGDIARPFTVQIQCYSDQNVAAHRAEPQVAQRAVLYEEDHNDPIGKKSVGSVIWRTEWSRKDDLSSRQVLAVRADVEIPDRRMVVTWSLQRNTDRALPASHTIEIVLKLPPDFSGGGIANVPGILMKQSEQARGTPLAGLAVKVTNSFFLVGLSAVETDVQHNIQLLKERPWFDIPIVYTSGGRAILAMEKGPPGDQAFAEAFAAWKTAKH